MTKQTELLKLAERVEAGEYDRRDVKRALLGSDDALSLDAAIEYTREQRTVYNALDGALDAAQALHDAVLPGWGFLLECEGELQYAYIWDSPTANATATAKTPAAAWVAAILRAKASMEKDDG